MIEYIDSKNQLADFLTKPISTKQFQDLVRLAKIKNCVSRGSVEQSRIRSEESDKIRTSIAPKGEISMFLMVWSSDIRI